MHIIYIYIYIYVYIYAYVHTHTYIYIYIYILYIYYINLKAINNVLDTKMVLKTHFFIQIFRLIYSSFISVYIKYTLFSSYTLLSQK